MSKIDTTSMLQPGTQLRNGPLSYRVEQPLAAGGFGNTYIAKQFDAFGRELRMVALKEFFMRGVTEREPDNMTIRVSNLDNMHQFEEQKAKLLKEAQRLSIMNSPYIVKVLDLFQANGTVYYAMEFIDGKSVEQIIKESGELFEDDVRHMLPQLLNALSEVHHQGFQHLDIKPANIMIRNTTRDAILIDFGASKQLTPDGLAATATGMAYTAGYAPREQMEQNMEKFGPWTDLYALGATIYRALTAKKPPMPSDIEEDPEEALPFHAGVSAPMRKLIFWLMTPRRSDRPQSVEEVMQYVQANGLAENLGGQPIPRATAMPPQYTGMPGAMGQMPPTSYPGMPQQQPQQPQQPQYPGMTANMGQMPPAYTGMPQQQQPQQYPGVQAGMGQPMPANYYQGAPTGMPSQSMPGVANQQYVGMPAPGYAQPMPQQQFTGMPSQGIPSQGIPSQGIPSQGIPSQGIPSQGVPSQGVPSQGVPSQQMQQPVQQPVQQPIQQPVQQPVQQPMPQPAPQPVAMPQPEPQPAPQPVAMPQPEPQPAPQPVSQPEPQPAPAPQPVPQPEPEPAPQPVSQPEPQPAPQPVAMPEPEPQPAPQPVAMPEPEPEPEPDFEPEPEPVRQPEPVKREKGKNKSKKNRHQPVRQPEPEPEPEPIPEPEPEPVYEEEEFTYDEQPKKSKTGLIIAILAVVAVIAGVVTWLLLPKGSDSEATSTEAVASADAENLKSVTDMKVINEDKEIGNYTYTGTVDENDKPHGKGHAKFDNGNDYNGPFVHGVMEGPDATFVFKGDGVYTGSFKQNRYDEGKYVLDSDGSYYEGKFENSAPVHGQCKKFDKNGKELPMDM